MDEILSGRIRSGDNVVFGISGSGQTVGAAVYTFDDLPDRLRERRAHPGPLRHRAGSSAYTGSSATARAAPAPTNDRRVPIEAIGTVPRDGPLRPTLELCRVAAEDCLARSGRDRSDIGLLLHAGVYHTEGVSEPAIAALIAGDVGINATFEPPPAARTLAFDILNGAVGFLQACYVAVQTIRAERTSAAMVVASEVEGDRNVTVVRDALAYAQLGSAVLLARTAGASGFGRFAFKSFPRHLEAMSAHVTYELGTAHVFFRNDPRVQDDFLACVPEVVHELLERDGLELSRVKAIFPPQISTTFIARLADALHVSLDRCIDVTLPDRDLFTSSLPYALQDARCREIVGPGDIGLLIAAGSGIQVGCALYHF
jgi:3-oxoacyl-[acyl-carrier-protein] synthase III